MAAYVHCNFHSCILRMQVDVSILLPEKERMEDVEQGKKGETFREKQKISDPVSAAWIYRRPSFVSEDLQD